MSDLPERENEPEWIVPHRDWRLGQSDNATAGCLWTLVTNGCLSSGSDPA